MHIVDRTTSAARRWAVGGALVAALAAAGCGGDTADSGGQAGSAPTTSAAATTPAATTPAATTPAAGAVDPKAGNPECAGLLQSVTAIVTKVGEANGDPAKTAAAIAAGAAAVGKEAEAVGGAAGQAGRKAAADIAAAGKALEAAKPGDPMAYVEATGKLVESALPVATACGVKQDG